MGTTERAAIVVFAETVDVASAVNRRAATARGREVARRTILEHDIVCLILSGREQGQSMLDVCFAFTRWAEIRFFRFDSARRPKTSALGFTRRGSRGESWGTQGIEVDIDRHISLDSQSVLSRVHHRHIETN